MRLARLGGGLRARARAAARFGDVITLCEKENKRGPVVRGDIRIEGIISRTFRIGASYGTFQATYFTEAVNMQHKKCLLRVFLEKISPRLSENSFCVYRIEEPERKVARSSAF